MQTVTVYYDNDYRMFVFCRESKERKYYKACQKCDEFCGSTKKWIGAMPEVKCGYEPIWKGKECDAIISFDESANMKRRCPNAAL